MHSIPAVRALIQNFVPLRFAPAQPREGFPSSKLSIPEKVS